jgi:hypothetical protein
MALAANPKKGTAKKAIKPTTLNCGVSLTTEPAAGSNTVDQGASQGSQYGQIHCMPSAFGGGVEATSFTVPDSGDTVGTYTQYFSAGSVRGAFDLTPGESAPPASGTAFQSQTWTGTVTVTGGSGVYKGIKGTKDAGVMNCTSPDSVHLSCTEKVKVTMPLATSAKK